MFRFFFKVNIFFRLLAQKPVKNVISSEILRNLSGFYFICRQFAGAGL
ncbi:hypothetical protein [Helicobacter sp. 16-1353]|nr:hypothetical protein [Helicobacter sp. 16-1353]